MDNESSKVDSSLRQYAEQSKTTIDPESMIDPSIPHSLQEVIARELEHDEKVVWSGMPKPWCFNKPTVHKCLFGISLTALTVTWTASGSGFTILQVNQALDLIPLAAFLFFFTAGIALLLSPLWTFRKSLKTTYVITDRRAIISEGGRSKATRSYPPARLTEMFRREHKDGTGDIVFERRISKDSEGCPHVDELGFLHIRDAKSVEARLKELAEQQAARSND